MGTGKWFLSSTEFKDWISGYRCILLLDGKSGLGKTIIASIVIDYLMNLRFSDAPGTDAAIFLYCRHNKTWTISQYLGSLIAQIFANHSSISTIAEHVLTVYDAHQVRRSRPSKTELVSILSNMIKYFKNVRVVLDGLDELPDLEQIELVSILRDLPVSLLITSRMIGFKVFDFSTGHYTHDHWGPESRRYSSISSQ
uniref:Nephrocystin 3-like N-terminal domain-containing protein n=1 Tax=Psilocybe cubensis TaxID=181762 RepID=A0A8H7Y719_PSICU